MTQLTNVAVESRNVLCALVHEIAMWFMISAPLSNTSGGFNARKTYLDQTRSGKRKAKDTGTTHRGTVPLKGGRTNQAFVQQQRRCSNRRSGNKEGLSPRGRYRCRYGGAHHRDHQRLANCYKPILFSRALDRAPLYELIGDDIVPQMMVNLLGISAEQHVFELTPLV
jgi:hypothetical protein